MKKWAGRGWGIFGLVCAVILGTLFWGDCLDGGGVFFSFFLFFFLPATTLAKEICDNTD